MVWCLIEIHDSQTLLKQDSVLRHGSIDYWPVRIFSIKKGKLEEAEQSLLKVFGPDYDAKQDVINISDNLQHLRKGSQSDECFKMQLSLCKENFNVKAKLPAVPIHFLYLILRAGTVQEK